MLHEYAPPFVMNFLDTIPSCIPTLLYQEEIILQKKMQDILNAIWKRNSENHVNFISVSMDSMGISI